MRIFILTLTLLSLLSLAACSPVYKTKYSYSAPESDIGKMCASGCLDKQNTCRTLCRLEKSNCERKQDLRAQEYYLEYVEEQNKKGEPVIKTPRSFRNYYFCNTASCDEKCEADHRICHSSCGGNTTERIYCSAFCD